MRARIPVVQALERHPDCKKVLDDFCGRSEPTIDKSAIVAEAFVIRLPMLERIIRLRENAEQREFDMLVAPARETSRQVGVMGAHLRKFLITPKRLSDAVTTEKQIVANRRNGRLSRGPKTAEGKRQVEPKCAPPRPVDQSRPRSCAGPSNQ